MKKYIVNRIKGTIEELSDKWAQNYVASKELEGKEGPEEKKQYESAIFNMGRAEEKIAWYKELLKKESL